MTIWEKMHSGDIYDPGEAEVVEEQTKCLDRLYEFNATRPTEMEKRTAMLKEMFAEIGVPYELGRQACPFRASHLRQFQPDARG